MITSPTLHPHARTTINRNGFTIVELLIVIVVIAILTAIAIVSYNGITANAKESALKSDLSTAAKKLGLEKVESGSYPSDKPSYISNTINYTGGGNSFCVSGETSGKKFHMTESGSTSEGDCPAQSSAMQTFTSAQCASLATFNGSNQGAVIQLTDSRGGITRTYQIGKLPDGKCWMLSNLKLGNASGSIALTPGDSNVADAFALPQLITAGESDLDAPQAIGPLPSETAQAGEDYGFLYNWSAATAGESRASHSENAGDAPHSICPSGWRLPTSSHFNQLDTAFRDIDNNTKTQQWQQSGTFKGTLSGVWGATFAGQGEYGFLWSSSVSPGNGGINASMILISAETVMSEAAYTRDLALGVRCVLNKIYL